MSTLDLFEKIRISQMAASLDLHPFEVARLMGQVGGLPRTLAFDQNDIDRVQELAGVETWWGSNAPKIDDDIPGRALVRTAASAVRAGFVAIPLVVEARYARTSLVRRVLAEAAAARAIAAVLARSAVRARLAIAASALLPGLVAIDNVIRAVVAETGPRTKQPCGAVGGCVARRPQRTHPSY